MTAAVAAVASRFPVPAAFSDLESAPYCLRPYPEGFDSIDGDDEVRRAEAFDELVDKLEEDHARRRGNGGGGGDEDEDEFPDAQALYTLVRKSASLSPSTRSRLMVVLCRSVESMCDVLDTDPTTPSRERRDDHDDEDDENDEDEESSPSQRRTSATSTAASVVVSQSFRDAFACHLYMLFNFVSLSEAEARSQTLVDGPKRKGRRRVASDAAADAADAAVERREACAAAVLRAARTMRSRAGRLWNRGVAEEDVASLPHRVAYQLLEEPTTAPLAAPILVAAAPDAAVVAALSDALHGRAHAAATIARDVCGEASPTVAAELLREISRTGRTCRGDSLGTGVRHAAPFVEELAKSRPDLVRTNLITVLGMLDAEPYVLRNAVVNAIGTLLERDPQGGESDAKEKEKEQEDETNQEEEEKEETNERRPRNDDNKTRDALLDVLTERAHDKNSFTRAAVLKVWIHLTETNSLPLNRVRPVADLAVDRLQDKTVNVRKYSMQLLTSLLVNNPFLGSLDPVPYQQKAEELNQWLLNNIPKDILDETRDAVAAMDAQSANDDNDGSPTNEDDEQQRKLRLAALDVAVARADENNDEEADEASRAFAQKLAAFRFTTAALSFVGAYEDAGPVFRQLMASSNPVDVTEALRLFVAARRFDLPCAVTGMKDALSLMWSPEAKVREEVLQAFERVFVRRDDGDLLPPRRVARNLLVLVSRASASETASVEEAIGALVEKESLPAEVFTTLWDVAAKGPVGARSHALSLVAMGARADPAGLLDSASRLKSLLDAGLGDHAEDARDWRLVRSAAVALQRLTRVDRAAARANNAKALVLERIVERLEVVVRGDWCRDDAGDDPRSAERDTEGWFAAVEQCVNALFVVCDDPEQPCRRALLAMEATTFGFGAGAPRQRCGALALARFLFVLGHVALKLLVHAEALGSAVRRANAAKSLKMQEEADDKKRNGGGSGRKKTEEENDDDNDDAETDDPATPVDDDDDDDIEAELGVAAEVEAETERRVDEICEKEIIGRGLIGMFTPLLVRVVANEEGHFSHHLLSRSATLALCKFMAISRTFCEKHLPLLFSRLQPSSSPDNGDNDGDGGDKDCDKDGNKDSGGNEDDDKDCDKDGDKDSGCNEDDDKNSGTNEKDGDEDGEHAQDDNVLRANIVVALGDLAFRFPNAVEPYTSRIYACLRDRSDTVKRHTLMVLTHLILNDMVKVKGQVCEIALCLEDAEARVRDMARLLFHELSKRSHNPVYNLLPDIVSRLSGRPDVGKDTFRRILSFLLRFIKKDRQVETLVVKFAQRFPTCDTIEKKADVAFCLANLPKLNEKCVKSLDDNFKLYKDALHDEDVFKSFATILTKAQKTASVGKSAPNDERFKDALREWEARLRSENEAGLENHRAGNKAERAKQRARRRAERRKKTRKVPEWEREDEDDDEDEVELGEDDEDDDPAADADDEENRPPTRSSRGGGDGQKASRRTGRTRKTRSSSSSSS